MTSDEDVMGKAYVHFMTWQKTYRGLIDDAYLDAFTLEKCESIARRFKDDIIVAKDEDGDVVGFAAYGAYRDGSMPGTGEVYAIYVLPEHQKNGVGLALMKQSLDALSEYDRVALWVLEGNDPAIRFYERIGFRRDGEAQTLMLGSPCREIKMVYTRALSRGFIVK